MIRIKPKNQLKPESESNETIIELNQEPDKENVQSYLIKLKSQSPEKDDLSYLSNINHQKSRIGYFKL